MPTCETYYISNGTCDDNGIDSNHIQLKFEVSNDITSLETVTIIINTFYGEQVLLLATARNIH